MRKVILSISEEISLKILAGRNYDNILTKVIMEHCHWYGRPISGTPYHRDFWSGNAFCSKRCKMENDASKTTNSQPTYSGQDSAEKGGCGSFIKKVIKWAIIIFIALIVLALITSK
jgi:hypothetical protein